MQKLRRVPFGSPSTGQKTHTTHTTRREELIMTKSRKGFTLVELLIVIVVIGILSAMMMLSSTEAVTSAKASNIVSNLRNLKTAALACYTDSMDYFADTSNAPKMKDIFKYLGSGQAVPESKDYGIISTNGWYLECTIKGTTQEVAQIKNKLKGRAKSAGLLNAAAAGDGTDASYNGGNDKVYYFIR